MRTLEDLLLQYIFENNIIKLVEIVDIGGNIHIFNEYPLILACSKGYLNIASYIINCHNPNLNAQSGLALKYACVYGHMNIIKLLLDNGANINEDNSSAILWSIYKYNYEITKYLIENGGNVNAFDGLLLSILIERNNIDMVKYFIEYGFNLKSELITGEYLESIRQKGFNEILRMILEKR